MLRIERDAAEDEYYDLKQKHDEAMWQIEDLESQIKSMQESGAAASVSHEEDLLPLEDVEPVATAPNNYEPVVLQSDAPVAIGERQSEVAYVDIDTRLTRGFDSHGKPGDDGVVVAIKPMDEAGQFLPIAAPVQISLIDPARSGIRQRVGLWSFNSQQVASRIDHKNGAFLFRLPWQRSAPLHSDLKLFVRFQADDGKRETEMDLAVSVDGQPVPPSQPTSQWTEVKKSDDASTGSYDLSPSTIQSPLVDTNLSAPSKSTDSPLRVARPEWSPYR